MFFPKNRVLGRFLRGGTPINRPPPPQKVDFLTKIGGRRLSKQYIVTQLSGGPILTGRWLQALKRKGDRKHFHQKSAHKNRINRAQMHENRKNVFFDKKTNMLFRPFLGPFLGPPFCAL